MKNRPIKTFAIERKKPYLHARKIGNMQSTQIEKAAQQLLQASTSGVPCAPIRTLIGEKDMDAAYQIQQVNHNLRLAEGARLVGKKIGLTSLKVQAQLGVDAPDFGNLYHDRVVAEGGSVSMRTLMQPKAEAEIAFVLKKHLESTEFTEAALIDAIDYAVVAIEIVGSRIENWDIRIVDTIADNASASHFVLGAIPKMIEDLHLTEVELQMFHNGQLVSTGKGADSMGSPLKALEWLAITMMQFGQPLQAGDIILTGALGPMVNVVAGDEIVIRSADWDEVQVRFEI